MISVADFVSQLDSFDVSPFLMIPCSIFEPLSSWLLQKDIEVIFPPNEANAMGFAVGSYCVTGQPAVIFLQNSGLNNIANCQTSLNLLYKIPVLLVVSWRGEKEDAPEHAIMGKNLKKFFSVLQIPFKILSNNWQKELTQMVNLAKRQSTPTAVVIRNNFFANENKPLRLLGKYSLSRFEAIEIIKKTLKNKAVFISTNGYPSRDSFAVLDSPDFYMMGSMGHAFSIGAGTSWALKEKNSKLGTVILDGDGGFLMHLESLAMVNLDRIKKSNLIYIVLDNEVYESTGSQPTLSPGINFINVAKGLGFPQVYSVGNAADLKNVISNLKPNMATFIHIKVNSRKTKVSIRVSDKYNCEQIAKKYRSNFQ